MRSEQQRPLSAAAERLALPPAVLDDLSASLPTVSERAVATILDSVPGYADAVTAETGQYIEKAVQDALRGFLRLAASGPGGDPATPMRVSTDGAYALGRGEARSGRTMDALLAAYRIGARVAWRDLSATAVASGMHADTVAEFAGLVFAYIDSLSAASVAGHTDELAAAGRARELHRERVAAALLRGRDEATLNDLANRAEWEPPALLAAVVLPAERIGVVTDRLGRGCLRAPDDTTDDTPLAILLAPVPDAAARRSLLRTLAGRSAYVGPTVPWTRARESYRRAMRALTLGIGRPADHVAAAPPAPHGPVDTDEHLLQLVVEADAAAWHDLRRRVLAPLAGLPPATTRRLADTLRSWLLHHGHRDAIAADLHVHPQTVRYRMGQIRSAYGEHLDDPVTVAELMVALAVQPDDVSREGR